MKEAFPLIRLRGRGGWLEGRDGVVVSFFIHRDHTEVAPAIWRAIETYRRAIPAGSLNWYTSADGDMVPLDSAGWEHNRREVIDCIGGGGRTAELRESPSETGGYQVEYYGRLLNSPFHDAPATALAFTFPTEYLLRHGAEHLRALAFELARELPFNFGYASFAIVSTQGSWASGDWTQLEALLSRYLGLDVYNVGRASSVIGTHGLGPHWLTFLGQPLLGRLGGTEALRSALPFPEASLIPMDDDRLLITLGEEPSALDTKDGAIPPQYLALGRMLKPFMFEYTGDIDGIQHDVNRWRRRLCP
ncbi:DUF3396 domain-containing protein [Corallococcus exiguus]|nr:DUF3396 domain-containing protein [Corallococcus exiguus]NNB99021.1 DUF3396 domain-containing protein [Corallococcus exiguus]NPC46989.1 DUF3396 domain-containing protein [Corallococcus exiguus]RKH79687.1 DUF3396 domain-containing protein [Corallococcus sp. AB032C]